MNKSTHHYDGFWQNVGECTDIIQNILEKFWFFKLCLEDE
jgi:hypothetical protein